MIRPARAADWSSVRALLIELGRPEPGPDDDAFRAYLAREDATAFVAEHDDAIVGFVDLEFRQRLNFDTPQAWIPDLIVTESHRGTGLGAGLLAAAEEAARARGCWGMTLESAAWREGAHAFYRSQGWADAGLAFTKSLDGTPWPPQRG